MSVANLSGPLAAVVLSPVLARAFGPSGRGDYAALTAPLVLIGIAGTLGSQDAAAYFVAHRRLNLREAIRMEALWLPFSGLVALVIAGAIALPLFSADHRLLVQYLILASLLPMNVAFNMLAGIFTGAADTAGVNAMRIIPTAVRTIGVLALFAVLPHLTPFIAALILLASPAVGLAWGLRRVRRREQRGSAERPSFAEFARVALLASPGLIASVSVARVDQAVGLPLIGAHQLGLYAVAVGVAELPMVVGVAGRVAVLGVPPGESSLHEQQRLTKIAVLGVGAGCLVLVLPTWKGLPFVFGSAFHAAVAPAIILLGATVIYVLGSCLTAILLSHGRTGAQSRALVLGSVIGVVLLVVLRGEGAVGASVASLGGYSVTAAICLFELRRLTPVLDVASRLRATV